MDSKEEANADGHRHNTATENSDTMALQRKRARRVSFAEMTSVHFFDRDEESNETPLAETAKFGDNSPGESGLGLQLEPTEFGGEDEANDNDDDEEAEMRRSFLRPVGSPSPGGSTFGSASSNDEDNFFGPVSANFIRPGRLSDSAASDDNHDVTMDSTAFSMHYRSLARSESGVDLKTPTGGKLFFEEKTLTDANTSSSMISTLGKNIVVNSSMPVTEVSGSHSSNDMSIVGENSNKYDYEKLSPGLVALLAESRNNFLDVGVLDGVNSSPSPKRSKVLPSLDKGEHLDNQRDSARKGLIDTHHSLSGDESADCSDFGRASGPSATLSSSPPEKNPSNALVTAASQRDNEKLNRSPRQFTQNGSEIPLASSTSSPVKRQEILLTTASPSNYWALVSPLPGQPGSFLRNEVVEHQETESSIQRSISKLELLEKSAFSSTFSDKVHKSTVKSLDFLRSPNFDTAFEKNRHISRTNLVEDSVTEETLATVDKSKSYFSMGRARDETPSHSSRMSPDEKSAKSFSTDQSRYVGPAASPSKITWSGSHLMHNLFSSKHAKEDALLTETESFLAEIASGEGGKAILTPKSVSSVGKILEMKMKLLASPGPRSSQSKHLLLQSPFKQISEFEKWHDTTPQRNHADVSLSTATVNSSSLSKGMTMTGELGSPSLEANCVKNFIEANTMDQGEVDMCNEKEIFHNFSSPAKENKHLNEVNVTSRDILRFEYNLHGTESRAVSHGSVSPPACRNLDEPRLEVSVVESPTASSLRKELGYTQSSCIPLPKTTQLSVRLENFSPNKRNIESLLTDRQHRTEMTITQRSPKFQKGENYDLETILYPNEERTLTGHEKKWTDICSKFFDDIKKLISESGDQLNPKMIDRLEDQLVHQQQLKIYEMLHLGVMVQNTTFLHDLQLQKMAATNSLLHQVVFKKAQLLLKHEKREKLLKRLQILNSRIKESQMLKENTMPQPLKMCTSNFLVDAVGDRRVNLMKGHEVVHEELSSMRQVLEALDGKILHMTRAFHACCKMKAEPSCIDTIALVKDDLTKRASFRLLCQDLQMWVVHSLGTVNGQLNVVLSYLDFIIQSIKITVGPTSSFAASFELNETSIIKSFPNMDACIAFRFVFDAGRTRKFLGSKTLAMETQVTSSLLGTLLDVVEEVQSAQMEFQNLKQASFLSTSVEQLNLMLCFFNFKSGTKVFLALDMSCLKCGIYPSQILPLHLASPDGGQKCSSSELIFDEIRDAVKRVRPGYMRVLRLCRCISQVVQASTS